MKTTMILAAIAAILTTGCQTRVQIERDEPSQILPVQDVREINGTNVVINTGYYVPPAHYCVTARSPLWAKESVARFAASVGDNGTWTINADGYERDLSTNAVAFTGEMFAGAAKLVNEVGIAYAKIAGGGAQADTITSLAVKAVKLFQDKGGNVDAARVTCADGACTFSDGTTTVRCQNGECEYIDPAVE